MRIEELEITLPFTVCGDRDLAIRRLREFVPESLLDRYDAMTRFVLADDDPPPVGEYMGCRIWVMCDGFYGYRLTFQPVSASTWSLEEAVAVDHSLALSARLGNGLEIHATVSGELREDAHAEQRANQSNGLPWSYGLDALS